MAEGWALYAYTPTPTGKSLEQRYCAWIGNKDLAVQEVRKQFARNGADIVEVLSELKLGVLQNMGKNHGLITGGVIQWAGDPGAAMKTLT